MYSFLVMSEKRKISSKFKGKFHPLKPHRDWGTFDDLKKCTLHCYENCWYIKIMSILMNPWLILAI